MRAKPKREGRFHRLPSAIAILAVLGVCGGLAVEYTTISAPRLDSGDATQVVMFAKQTTGFFLTLEQATAPDQPTPTNQVRPATEVTVLEQKGPWAHVRVDGWQQQGVALTIYAFQGVRIQEVTLDDQARQQIEVHLTHIDPVREQVWYAVSLEGWVWAADFIEDRTSLWQDGSNLLHTSCSVCHIAPEPEKYNANIWPKLLNAMVRNVNLDEEQLRFLLSYVQYNASDVKKLIKKLGQAR